MHTRTPYTDIEIGVRPLWRNTTVVVRIEYAETKKKGGGGGGVEYVRAGIPSYAGANARRRTSNHPATPRTARHPPKEHDMFLGSALGTNKRETQTCSWPSPVVCNEPGRPGPRFPVSRPRADITTTKYTINEQALTASHSSTCKFTLFMSNSPAGVCQLPRILRHR